MNKIISITLALLIFVCSLFAFASCGVTPPACTEHTDADGDGICDTEGCGEPVEATPDDSGNNGNSGNNSDYFNENGELVLYRDGVPTFTFVKGTGLSGSGPVDDLATLLTGLSKSPVKAVKSTDTDDIQDVEIIFGTVTNRGDEYKFDVHTLGLQGYIVRQVGTKIFVVAGSDTVYTTAINYLKSTVFGITRTTPDFTDLVMNADKNKEAIQNNYSVKDVTLDGASLRGYTLAYDNGDSVSKGIATGFQAKLYEKTGIWLPISRFDKLDSGAAYVKIKLIENDGEGGGFYFNIDKNKNATLECEYENKFVSLAETFFEDNIFANGIKGKVTLKDYNPDFRNVYYEDYGAVGDGETDDFFAIKAAHDDANANKLIVHANSSSTYYIGNANGKNYITVKTDTYWHGCGFIFDDEDVVAYGSGMTRNVPIFYAKPDTPSITYYQNSTSNPLPFTTLERGQKNVGWEPGATMMIVVYNSNVKHYIRYGANADSGQDQHELIIIDKNGNVDELTPVQWNYETITRIECYNVDDAPIVIKGEGDDGKYTKIETKYNNGPNAYTYYDRNIRIRRSNVTLSGIEHFFTSWTPYDEGGKGSPYSGFTQVEYCNNVVVENMIFECPETYYDVEMYPGKTTDPTGANMGSYEMNATCANNVLWRNCRQSNFFEPDGSKKFDGAMGTNFCKNLNFDKMFVCSFDAHCGVYNGTIKNSTVDHLNFIGDGQIIIEDVTIYAGYASTLNSVINLRTDYGSTWRGDLYIDGLIFKVPESFKTSERAKNAPLHIISASHTNHFFGYTCYLPQNITIKNLLVEEIAPIISGAGNGTNNRTEKHIAYNTVPVYIFPNALGTSSSDITHPTFGFTGAQATENKNPTVVTASITHFTTYPDEYAELGINSKLTIVLPTSVSFRNTKINIDPTEEE